MTIKRARGSRGGAPPEPPRITDIGSLEPYVAERVRRILARLRQEGWDPVIHEARRTPERQAWLYGIGRWHSLDRQPVTQTLRSKHLTGKAVDIVSRRHGWSSGEFFDALKRAAEAEGMTVPYGWDRAHVEWRG